MFVRATTHVVVTMNINCLGRGHAAADGFFLSVMSTLLIIIPVLALAVAPRASTPILHTKKGLPYQPKPAILRRQLVKARDSNTAPITLLS